MIRKVGILSSLALMCMGLGLIIWGIVARNNVASAFGISLSLLGIGIAGVVKQYFPEVIVIKGTQ